MRTTVNEEMTGKKRQEQQVIVWQTRAILFLANALLTVCVWTWMTMEDYAKKTDLLASPPIMRVMPALHTFPARIDELENSLHSIPAQLSMVTASQDRITQGMERMQGKFEAMSSEIQSIKITLATQQSKS
ncbi:MAG: hypothetical protein NPIRA02_29440 [Nitrospirales bacterium]|nr:MAG: hypothetical protein NPIRA02_29440 [Nitrospirales bacterium]